MNALVHLRAPSGGLEATFAPAANLVCCSLRHRGEEVLGQRNGLDAYLEKASTMGIPLLHPWANRLARPAYAAAGRTVRFDPDSALVKLDPNGLPIHGVAPRALTWDAQATGTALEATLRYEADELLAIFPFPHELRAAVRLDDDGLRWETSLRPTGGVSTPVAFGYHPYFALPGVPRAQWHVELPVRRRVLLDDRGLPTGATEPVGDLSGPLGDRTLDDGFDDLADPPTFALSGGGRRVELTFESGYPFAQVYAPPDQELIALEPMTAPTNALVPGEGLSIVEPGATYTAAFKISVGAD